MVNSLWPGKKWKRKLVLAPGERVAVLRLPIDLDGPGVQKRGPQPKRSAHRQSGLVEHPDFELVAVGQMIDAVVMIVVGVA